MNKDRACTPEDVFVRSLAKVFFVGSFAIVALLVGLRMSYGSAFNHGEAGLIAFTALYDVSNALFTAGGRAIATAHESRSPLGLALLDDIATFVETRPVRGGRLGFIDSMKLLRRSLVSMAFVCAHDSWEVVRRKPMRKWGQAIYGESWPIVAIMNWMASFFVARRAYIWLFERG